MEGACTAPGKSRVGVTGVSKTIITFVQGVIQQFAAVIALF